MVDVDTSGFDEAIASVEALGADLEPIVGEQVADEADNLVEMIENKIKSKGLVDSGELLASFHANQAGASTWVIWSSADHAMPIEEGASPHEITPDTAPFLAFRPENPSEYSEVINDDGWVTLDRVGHPGNKPYRYILEAQSQWKPVAMIQISKSVDRAIRAAGFSRARALDDPGGMPGGIGGPDFIDG